MLLKDRRIFIIEDKYMYVAIASVYLRHEGAVVEAQTQTVNIPQVLLSHLPIDLILIDLAPSRHISGFDIFDQIRRVPELARIPVVAVSAVDPATVIPLARQKGFAGFISMPFSSTITGYIARILKGEQVWAAESWQPWLRERNDPSGNTKAD